MKFKYSKCPVDKSCMRSQVKVKYIKESFFVNHLASRLSAPRLICLQCTHIPGLGFRRGSYRCECKEGFYFPEKNSPVRYYNGTVIEEEYEKKLMVRK